MSLNVHAPHAEIVYPQVTSLRQFVTEVTVRLGETVHPVAEVTVAFSAPLRANIQGWLLETGRLIPEDAPVHLVYGSGPHQRSNFFGYVQSYSIATASDDTRFTQNTEVSVTYTLVGATSPLQTQTNRTWIAASPSYIARTICRDHMLAPMVQRDVGRLGARAQNAQSDWVFLRKLAAECGLRLVVDNTNVCLTDPLVSLREGREVPAFFLTKLPGIRDTVDEFRVTTGELDPASGRRTRSESFSYNPATRHLSRVVDKATSRARSTTFATQLPSASQTMATRRAVSQPANAQLWVQAVARVRGDARVRPGTEVWMQGAGMGPRNTGQWMVLSAHHHLELHLNDARKSVYSLSMMVGRNRPDGLDAVPRSRVLPAPVRTVLTQGRWRAEHTGAA
ncbi:hypothetical protein [Streptomyces sp. UNOC14_S4]|uniref:hypothetical protein n=1 Tax=Streptomyces sp. UNOC14_S4 TaxID=2872340 RepID=UPI001E32EDF3|nr:hypothetical protein [Streptomyces sp. UNOC14_S4]MCC3766036.1 hypothetical protein [Streptomyces sp. UNOC14_S4]